MSVMKDFRTGPEFWIIASKMIFSKFYNIAGFGQTCSNMHLVEVYGGKFSIFSIFSGFCSIRHFHHCNVQGAFIQDNMVM